MLQVKLSYLELQTNAPYFIIGKNDLLMAPICDPPREKVPLGTLLNFSVQCKKSTYVYFVENQFVHQAIILTISYHLIVNTKRYSIDRSY